MLTDAKIPGSSDLRKCRLCFEAEITLIYIYKFGGSLKKIARTILDVLNHEVSKDDQFPPYVCVCCSGKLLEFRAFKTKCDSLRNAYQFYLTSRQDWTKSIEEKVEIEEINDEKEQLSNTHVLEEDPASENSKVEIEEGNAEKEQLSDTHVLEEDSASEKSQVEIEEINDEKEQRLDSHVMEEDPASEKSQEAVGIGAWQVGAAIAAEADKGRGAVVGGVPLVACSPLLLLAGCCGDRALVWWCSRTRRLLCKRGEQLPRVQDA